jgi:hypothetical protein
MTAARNLILPSSSRQYVINNNTTGGFALTVKGSATSGVTMVNGEKAHVFWNGSDYAKLSNTPGGAGTFSSITNTGLTSGRVVYSTTGGLETDSANLTFDGSRLGVGVNAASYSSKIATNGNISAAQGANLYLWDSTDSTGVYIYNPNNSSFAFGAYGGSEYMRINNSGNVGIGTTSPGTKLNVATAGADVEIRATTTTSGDVRFSFDAAGAFYNWIQTDRSSGAMRFAVANAERMRIDSSGNLLTGLTSNAGLTVGGGSVAANGVLLAKGALSDHQTSAGVLEYTSNKVSIRAYGATAGTGFIAFNTGGGGGSADTERMRIDTSGNVGIGGTPSGSYKLQVTNSTVYVGVNSDGTNGVIESNGPLFVRTNTANPLVFGANTTERMRIDSSGNVGIGTSSPNQKLQVNNSAAASSFALFTNATTGSASGDGSYFGVDSSGLAYAWNQENTAMLFGTNNGERMRIDSSGNVGVGATNPSSYGKLTTIAAAASTAFYAGSSTQGVYISNSTGTDVVYNSSGNSAGAHVWQTGNTEAMRIDSSGNVGIGTSSPAQKLDVKGVLQLTNSATPANTSYIYDGGGLLLSSNNSSPMYFYTGAAERMRIDSSGNLLVGTTSYVAYATGVGVAKDGTLSVGHITGTVSGVGYALFGYNGGGIGSITQSGTTAVLYNVTSDQRLKENIQDAESASALIDSLQVRQFDWKTDNTHQRYGFVAQELITVAPEAVHQPADPEEMMAVDYSKLVPMLVKEIQSLRKRLADAGIA